MMTRDDGLMRADIDVAILTDPKMAKLRRSIPDDGERAITVLLYLQTLLGSWREGRRLTAEESEVEWAVTPDRVTALQGVGLLDAEGRVPETAWQRHFVPAAERIAKRRESGRIGGQRSAERRAGLKHRSSIAQAPLEHRSSIAQAPLNPASQPAPPPPLGGGGWDPAGARGDAPAGSQTPAPSGFSSIASLLPEADRLTGFLGEHLERRRTESREH